MNARVPLLLLALSLAGVVIAEWRLGQEEADLAGPAPAAMPLPTPRALRLSGPADPVLRERPPFAPDRRPTPVEVAPVGGTVSDGEPRLAGIIVAPSGSRAIFAVPGAAKPVTLDVGGKVGRYTVERIEPDEVTVLAGDARRQLRPTFPPAGADAAPAATDGPAAPPPPAFLNDLAPRPAVAIPRQP